MNFGYAIRLYVTDSFMDALEPYLLEMFNKADQGIHNDCAGNGQVTFEEIVANVDGVDGSHIDRVLFDYVDTDEDGIVTWDEFKLFCKALLTAQLGADADASQYSPESVANAIKMLLLSG